MNNSIFREKSLSKVNSPEKLNDYIRLASPGTGLIALAMILIIIGAIIALGFQIYNF